MWVVFVAQEANFISSLCYSLDGRQHASTQEHRKVCVCLCVWGGAFWFCSIVHNNNSQRTMEYYVKLLRLWPKWFGHKEKSRVPAGPNLKNSAWASINSPVRSQSSLLAEELQHGSVPLAFEKTSAPAVLMAAVGGVGVGWGVIRQQSTGAATYSGFALETPTTWCECA